MILVISLIGVGVAALIALIVFLVVRRKARMAKNEEVWFLLKKSTRCPFCTWWNYIRRRDVHYWCSHCGKGVDIK
jgi:transposase-like protein